MNQQTFQAITTMLNAFPQSAAADTRALLLTFDAALTGVSAQAVCEAAQRYTAGLVPAQNLTFAPSVAEFVTEARKQADVIAIRSQPRIAPPTYRPGRLAPFQITAEKAKAANAHRAVIKENASLEEYHALMRACAIPKGSTWIACLATIYGPEPKQQSVAAE